MQNMQFNFLPNVFFRLFFAIAFFSLMDQLTEEVRTTLSECASQHDFVCSGSIQQLPRIEIVDHPELRYPLSDDDCRSVIGMYYLCKVCRNVLYLTLQLKFKNVACKLQKHLAAPLWMLQSVMHGK